MIDNNNIGVTDAKFSLGTCMGRAWQLLVVHYGVLLQASLIATAVIGLATGLLLLGFDKPAVRSLDSGAIAWVLLYLPVVAMICVCVNVGTVWLAVRLVRGDAVRVLAMFDICQHLRSLIRTTLVLGAIQLGLLIALSMLVALTAADPSTFGVGLAVCTRLAAAIAVVAVHWRLAPAYVLSVDAAVELSGRPGGMRIARDAWKMTARHTLDVIAFAVLLAGLRAGPIVCGFVVAAMSANAIVLGIAIALAVDVLIARPLSIALCAVAYNGLLVESSAHASANDGTRVP